AQFWSRRFPSFKKDFDERVAAADQSFSYGRTKGSTTDRGKVFILFGNPTRIQKKGGRATGAPNVGSSREQMLSSEVDEQGAYQTWIYEGTDAKAFSGRAEITFFDRFNSGEFKMQTPKFDFNAAQEKLVTAFIRPERPQQAAQPQPAAPVAPSDALKTQALKDAIAAAKGGSSKLKKGNLVYAEFVAPSGDFYVPIGIIVPKGEGVSADAYDTIFGQVEDANGAVVSSFEQTTTPTVYKGGVFVDRALNVSSGKYTAVVGLAKAGAPVAIGTQTFEVTSGARHAPGTAQPL